MSYRDNIKSLPWVRELDPARDHGPCEGIKWGTVAVRDLYETGGKPARGIQQRSRCKMRARWSYTFVRKHWVTGKKTERYCWHHLVSAVHEEMDRNSTWRARHSNEPQGGDTARTEA